MNKFAYRNKFRIVDELGNILRLNTIINVKGSSQFIEGFDTLLEAQAARDIHAFSVGLSAENFTIQPYAEQYVLSVPVVTVKSLNKELEKRKIFSGKALPLNTTLRESEERKYKPDKYYTHEIWLAQSVERNKGKSTLPREKKRKNEGLNDTDTFLKLERLRDSSFMESSIIKSVLSHKFKNRKELKNYLQPLGFSHRRIEKIFHLLTT